ncbi:MAG: T9SS type A sorting domain-containing protein [Saprospiraceae bacterium]|nr:T9SS type A sorting domain-containing protein [Saprospiraceae bacterium]
MNAICITDYHTCHYYEQYPCSEGYCWGSGNITPNQGIPTGGIVSDKWIEIGGDYKITQNVTFINCKFKMRSGSSISIEPTGGGISQVTFDHCDFFGCNYMWRGISINASGAQNFGFTFNTCRMEDAYVGLALDEGKPYFYSIFDNFFFNNHIGISNRKQTGGLGSMINATIIRNLFASTAQLSPVPPSMQSLPMPNYPLSYAGIKYVNASTTVGALSTNVNTANNFSCLVNGIIGDHCSLISNNNIFETLNPGYGKGIWGIDGSMTADQCHFTDAGQFCIYSDGADLTARQNTFGGSSQGGIYCLNNLNAEFIRIEGTNTFNISTGTWRSGIEIKNRSVATTGVHNIIRHNVFNVSDNANLLSCIEVAGASSTTDEMHIDSNQITVFSNTGVVYGIEVSPGSAQGYKIRGNLLNYQSTQAYGSFGIFLQSQSGITGNNEIRNNSVWGATNQSIQCSFHSLNLEGTVFCRNSADHSVWGFHFKSQNDVVFRENHANRHEYGVFIQGADAQIGIQYGRGNIWSTNPNDYTAAAKVEGDAGIPADPNNSKFLIKEQNTLPYLPPSTKIFPTPNPPLDWFKFDPTISLDYCIEGGGPNPISLTPYEKAVVFNAPVLTSVPLWDLQRKTYTKLLLYPSLRPGGSSEETYFNSKSGSVMAYLGQVEQTIANSLALSIANQQALDNYRQAIIQYQTGVNALDASANFSSPANLTGTWYSSRADQLEQVAVNTVNQLALETVRNQPVNQGLQSALTFNTNISTAQTWESARKTLNNIRIRHLLHEPLTQAFYQQILALAQQDKATGGSAVGEVVTFIAPCDLGTYLETDAPGERNDEGATPQQEASKMLRIVPNPTSGLAEVTMPKDFAGVLTVVDASGRKVHSTFIEQGKDTLTLDLSRQLSGLYWISLSDENGRIVTSSKLSIVH